VGSSKLQLSSSQIDSGQPFDRLIFSRRQNTQPFSHHGPLFPCRWTPDHPPYALSRNLLDISYFTTPRDAPLVSTSPTYHSSSVVTPRSQPQKLLTLPSRGVSFRQTLASPPSHECNFRPTRFLKYPVACSTLQ
jgi:hypothetical protein